MRQETEHTAPSSCTKNAAIERRLRAHFRTQYAPKPTGAMDVTHPRRDVLRVQNPRNGYWIEYALLAKKVRVVTRGRDDVDPAPASSTRNTGMSTRQAAVITAIQNGHTLPEAAEATGIDQQACQDLLWELPTDQRHAVVRTGRHARSLRVFEACETCRHLGMSKIGRMPAVTGKTAARPAATTRPPEQASVVCNDVLVPVEMSAKRRIRLDAVIDLLEQGMTREQAAGSLGLRGRQVVELLNALPSSHRKEIARRDRSRKAADPARDAAGTKRGARTKLSGEHRRQIAAMLDDRAPRNGRRGCTVSGMREYVRTAFGITISAMTATRELKRIGLRHVQGTRQAVA